MPLILALGAIALFVRHQAITLAQQQRTTVQQAYLASKEAELKHYVALATHSVAHLYDSGRSDPATLEEAKRILAALSYGDRRQAQGTAAWPPRSTTWRMDSPTAAPRQCISRRRAPVPACRT